MEEIDIRRIHKTSHIQALHDIRGYCCPTLIWEVDHIKSEVEKYFLEDVLGKENEGVDHGCFRVR